MGSIIIINDPGITEWAERNECDSWCSIIATAMEEQWLSLLCITDGRLNQSLVTHTEHNIYVEVIIVVLFYLSLVISLHADNTASQRAVKIEVKTKIGMKCQKRSQINAHGYLTA